MKPSWTRAVWPPVIPLVSLVEAKNWLGVYGDASLDDEIQNCLDSAVEKVSSSVDYRISDTKITDYFKGRSSSNKLILSEPGIDTDTIVVKYFNDDEVETTIAEDKYSLDDTAREYTIQFREDGFPSDVSLTKENPIFVKYNSKLSESRGFPTVERLQYAVRLVLNFYWQNRGEIADPHAFDKNVSSIVNSARIDGPVAT